MGLQPRKKEIQIRAYGFTPIRLRTKQVARQFCDRLYNDRVPGVGAVVVIQSPQQAIHAHRNNIVRFRFCF